MNQQQTDQELIDRILAGHTGEFAGLVERYQHMVFTLVVRVVRDRELAEEVAQDAFVKAYQGLEGYRGSARFSTWLYKIAYHRALDAVAVANRRQSYSAEFDRNSLGIVDSGDTWTRLMEQERSQLVREALDLLAPEDRSVLVLFYLQEQNLREVAQITGMRPGTVKVRLHRARERMKELLAETSKDKVLKSYGR